MKRDLAQSELVAGRRPGPAVRQSANWRPGDGQRLAGRAAAAVDAVAPGSSSDAVEERNVTAGNDGRGRQKEKALRRHGRGKRSRLEASAQTVDESGPRPLLVVEPR